MIIHSRLNVLFDDPFWVGIFEREYEGRYEAARVVFGAEPKDYEVYEFFIKITRGLCSARLWIPQLRRSAESIPSVCRGK